MRHRQKTPLHYIHADEDVLIDGVGEDRQNHGGKLARSQPIREFDDGFRLWNPDRRRQAWKGSEQARFA